ncbi:uncharacterized protein LOC105393109 [Plutella xylostella]|uniref:uncharacterized protein LOC105393109 n=1 Tax=Plutella xylostella TaxID=51655 RepID=UPI002032D78B|nr:uncharacterized protein LOC105393109 [Plutella xylostella]
MESLAYNFAMEDTKPTFTTATDMSSATTAETPASSMPHEGAFTPLPPAFHGHSANELLHLLAQQEPRAADTAPTTSDFEEMMMNFRINGSEMAFDETDSNHNNYYSMGSRAESVASSRGNMWSDRGAAPRHNDQMTTFDFLVKSVSAANNYVSMLTREQLSVLQALRPSLLYEFLQEVAKVRSDKRMRRALPNECAFCKNNGENEECYSSHALKDWRGRVLCPVLRAFRCPRCGATGDWAHTIKYCQENNDNERTSSLSSRRRAPPSASLPLGGGSLGGGSAPPSQPPTPTHAAPPPSPSANNVWSTFGMNNEHDLTTVNPVTVPWQRMEFSSKRSN